MSSGCIVLLLDSDIHPKQIPGYVNIIANLLSHWSQDLQAESKFYHLHDANKFVFHQCPDNVFDLSLDVCTIIEIDLLLSSR